MDFSRTRAGEEVLGDRSYLKVCRAAFAFRLLTCAMTSALTPPETGAATMLLLFVAVVSAWGAMDDGFVRRYFRHPSLAAVDVLALAVLLTLEWPDTLALLVLASGAMLIGLTLTPLLSLPALILLLGAIVVMATDSPATPASGVFPTVAAIGMPAAVIGMTGLGWTVRHAFVELKRTRDQVMFEQVQREGESERARLARAMHDSLGKTVNGISLAANALETASRSPDLDTGAVAALAGDIRSASQVAADESRALLRALRRHQVDRPVAEQLGELARSHATSGFQVRTTVTGVVDLPHPVTIQLVAIAHEALENVVRHARARSVQVELGKGPDGVRLSITDDGRGFDPAVISHRERAGHFGLRGMQERAAASGGSCDIDSAPGRGTTLTCSWPTHALEETDD